MSSCGEVTRGEGRRQAGPFGQLTRTRCQLRILLSSFNCSNQSKTGILDTLLQMKGPNELALFLFYVAAMALIV